MNSAAKDHPVVIKFLAAFSRLRNACDDDPKGIVQQAVDDESFAKICAEVCEAYYEIVEIESDTSDKSVRFVGKEFIKARRLFEMKFRLSAMFSALNIENFEAASQMAKVESIALECGRSLHEFFEDRKRGKAFDEIDWESENEKADKRAQSVHDALDYAWENYLSGGDSLNEFNDLYVGQGLENLTMLHSNGFGPDLTGLYRRRALTPLTLIPTSISHGSSHQIKVSALTLLEEAQSAFIFGTPFATLTLLRAIVEIVLTEHFRIQGRDLKDQINKSAKLLPPLVYPSDLHRLRMDANSLLHDRGAKQAASGIRTQMDLELSVANHLDKVRLLLEGFSK